MKRSEMTCTSCIKFDGSHCRLAPATYSVNDPQIHWCAQGQWHEWSDRYQELEPFYWGEWQEESLIN